LRPADLWAPTRVDERALAALLDEPIDWRYKAAPFEALTLAGLRSSRLRLLEGDLPLPVLALRASALRHNIEQMQRYCDERGMLFAPHAKTTMAPQLVAEQVQAGCWAVTCATPAHLRVYRRFGVGRILYANQLVEPVVIRWLADELRRDETFQLYCLVDSPEGVALLDRALRGRRPPQPLPVLIELGHAGGRAGCRSHADVQRVVRALEEATALRLAGIEAFEGLIRPSDVSAGLGAVDDFLAEVAGEVATLATDGTLPPDAIVTAGGSAYFDRVVEAFEPLRAGSELHFVLRSGCYLTQDAGYYEQVSPAARGADAPELRNAIEVWGAVLSRPEPGLVIVGFGKRDVPSDLGPPRPVAVHRRGHGRVDITAHSSLAALSDQHAHVRLDPQVEAAPGDLLACTISHPCTAFDKWRFIPVVDDEDVVVDGLLTFF
jgi:D-serine dehydratase